MPLCVEEKNMSARLDGKVAVVTGGGSGMGAEMARRFVAEGAKVVVADISGQQDAVARDLGSSSIAVRADVSKSADVRAMLDAAVETFGRLDILSNNAGVEGAMAPTGEYNEDEFDRVWRINGRAIFLGMRYAIPLMQKTGGGSIINTASIASMVAFPTMIAYCAAKGAVLMMTKTAAVEYAKAGIRVNAICPGPIRTGIVQSMPAEYIDAVTKMIPAGRIGDAAEVANLAVYLASDESKYLTGAGIVIDGGYTSQ
jgi:NAD(P)-dependent dehydrogenase (short-subunit alcohol dehydrogenase family)